MKDITWDFKVAISKNVLWSINEFYIVIEEMKKNNYGVSFWKDEENWASIDKDNNVVGYLWRCYPLMLIVDNYTGSMQILLQEFNFIVFVEVSSLTEKELKLNYNEVMNELDFGINYDRFSAEDLWFGNVVE